MADLANEALAAAATKELTGLAEHGTARILANGPFRVEAEVATGTFIPIHEARGGGLVDVGYVGTKLNIVNTGAASLRIRVGAV